MPPVNGSSTLADNDFLNKDNGGYTVFGNVIGDGMKLVETMAEAIVVPAAEYITKNSALNELPLWDVNVGSQDGNDIANVRPDDFLTITEASKLGKKDSLATYEVSSSDPSGLGETREEQQNQNHLKWKSEGKVDVTVTATSRLDGTTTEDSFDVIVGASRRERNGNKRQTIDLYIDGGSLDAPHYNVYDSEGVLIDDLLINPRNKYTFSTTPESPWLRAGQNRATGMLISSTDSQTLR